MKHTQGKWSVRGRKNLLVVGSENQDPIIIASVAHDNFGNARLIANAPEMLFCLQELQFNLLSEDASGNSLAKEMSIHQMERLAETIAKAEGK